MSEAGADVREADVPAQESAAEGSRVTVKPLNVGLDCGWGTLHFADTYESSEALADAMRSEGPGRRDIAFYVEEPHVMLSAAPLELFLDPSHAFRLDLEAYEPSADKPRGFVVRRLTNEEDAEAVNRIYASRGMVAVRPDFFWRRRDSRAFIYLVAEDEVTGAIIGTVTGIDHARAFGDPNRGTSLWCLAVDPQTRHSGVGEALVRRLADLFKTRGCRTLDLSVLHDNDLAIQLYEKLGFERLAVYTLKRKNPINERLFAGPAPEVGLNPYARIIVEEARRRGIDVEIIDAENGYFRLTYGGRSLRCRESLSEMTSAVAMSICDDKAVTRSIVERAGIAVPDEIEASTAEEARALFERHERIVLKPARGEQGRGISVGLAADDDVEAAFARAREVCERVLVEEFVEGDDLRLVVIDHRVVAAAVRKAARVFGDGKTTVRALIERQSRRRSAATGGEASIPMDAETDRCLRLQGFDMESVPEDGREVQVRRTANLHTGGTIHDVTDHVHPALVDAAVRVSRAIDIPVVGVDLMVPSHRESRYRFIEANERPGLANHEPQPTAERFIDLLFPLSVPHAVRQAALQGVGETGSTCPA
ncbi:N-acetylglutaminylglutamine synthetase [Acuticoccus kandeliae]|uniref:N-acetylglutaminylglutamine synthetase n=1 Tax=Acuticoccus kandeliae TaxID=2073160 RepID=UPI001472DF78|nr:N-acetylglutaminylglutamine synthetase [Acuticoccus kandeliae]